MITRRRWLQHSAGAALGAGIAPRSLATTDPTNRAIPEYEKAMFDLPGLIKDPVKIATAELLKRESTYFVRTRSTGGAVGLAPTKQVELFVPIFKELVAPYFVGKDAREIETLVDGVYRENYKLAGLAFWCPVAYLEQSVLDMLGRIAGKPVGALLGGTLRKEFPVYLSGSERDLSAEQEVDIYVRGVAETGAKAVKFKIGGRMSRNADAAPGRTERLLKLARERLGDKLVLYADANGSYDAKKGIEVGRMLQDLNFSFFEEPCPFEELSETQSVAKALRIPVAFGEQNFSLWQFQWMLRNGVMSIAQPDINYNGGLIRATRVARIAESLGKTIVPHNTQTGVASANIVQFASRTRNTGPFMEYPWRQPQRPQSWYAPNFEVKDGALRVPDGPGLGIEVDPDYVSKAEVVVSVGRSSP